ncbi:MAG: bifunctional folylpolyglutamate synthase/dihydrofolate synthase [Gammaproteobacteria bacterium]|nr:bifunctional folylpolyglutamate synthase/dihydrofolate synthase [Gammaproteobacteria bacterium]MDH3447352.1 bifunctional folylpolyglutamate synthase/dihydrofolate synthase [Gammaproteobacteria bacterium]
MRFDTVERWLQWQMGLHGKAIDLGLDRVLEVGSRLGIDAIADKVITVAGTNGKGSTVAAYENWLHRAGFDVASYTSPHLLNYNERIKHNLLPVSDALLCDAFAAVEQARQATTLTYFEYGTLAALFLFQQWHPEFVILEVGLGGRLDAVNIIDADLVHLTPISLDHQAWLGDDREKIGYEKAGVLRDGIAVVLNDPDPPQSILAEIDRRHCDCLRLGRDYQISEVGDNLVWKGQGFELQLDNVLPGAYQCLNLAGVVAGLSRLLPLSRYQPAQVREFFHGTQLAGRFQALASPLPCRLYVDVGHNPGAARVLATSLERIDRPQGRIIVLLGMLEDKQPELFVEALKPIVDLWWLVTLDRERGLSAGRLEQRTAEVIEPDALFEDMPAALDHALSSLGNQDIMLVTGSFITVELLLRALADSGELNEYGSKH